MTVRQVDEQLRQRRRVVRLIHPRPVTPRVAGAVRLSEPGHSPSPRPGGSHGGSRMSIAESPSRNSSGNDPQRRQPHRHGLQLQCRQRDAVRPGHSASDALATVFLNLVSRRPSHGNRIDKAPTLTAARPCTAYQLVRSFSRSRNPLAKV
jgi:hypothetical protein